MSLQDRLSALLTAVGADIKSLYTKDAAQQVQIDAFGVPWKYTGVAADQATTSTATTDVTGLALPTNLAAGTYEIEAKIWYRSAATGTAGFFTFGFPAQVTQLSALWEVADVQYSQSIFYQTASGAIAGGAGSPSNSASGIVGRATAFFTCTGVTMATPVKIGFATEISGSAITVKAGSYLRYRKVI